MLVLLNDDTIVPPGWLSGLAAQLDDPAIGLVGADDESLRQATRRFDAVVRDLRGDAAVRATGAASELAGDAAARHRRRRDVLRRAAPRGLRGGRPARRALDAATFEDDYARRVRDAGYRVACAEDVFVHRFGAASLGGPADARRRRRWR